MEDVLRLTYFFIRSFQEVDIINKIMVTGQDIISESTIMDICSHCREVCMVRLDVYFEESGQIEGPSKIVEIVEMKFGCRKYERGHVIQGTWIFGALDIETNDLRLEIFPLNKRDRATLIPVIRKHIAPGSKICSYSWKSYDVFGDEGYEHVTCNH